MAYLLLAPGFEESEAVVPADLLRQAEIETALVSLSGPTVTGAHNITIQADLELSQVDLDQAEMIVLPGGLGGVNAISASAPAMEAIRQAYEDGKYVAAICAGPTVLASLGITDGKHATSYPGAREKLSRAIYEESPVVTDGKLITSRGPGTSMALGLELARILCGEAVADEVAHGMLAR